MFLYTPNACKKVGTCRLQIVLHGCIQGYPKVGMDFAKKSGFLEYAASNNIVVIFP
jgi:hypothetical protein